MTNKERLLKSRDAFLGLLSSSGYDIISEYINSTTPILLKCPNGHEYKVSPKSFKRGYRCITCKDELKKNVFTTNLEDNGYLLIDEYSNDTTKKVKLLCSEGHEWSVRIADFNNGVRCTSCKNVKSISARERFLSIIENEGYGLLSEYVNSKIKVKLLCPEYHEWNVRPNDFISSFTRCPHCQGSTGQRQLQHILEDNLSHRMVYNDREVLDGLELDIYFPELGIAIEYQGNYWHSKPEAIKRDEKKRRLCKDKNINLIEVWDDDFMNNKDVIVKGILNMIDTKIVKVVDGTPLEKLSNGSHKKIIFECDDCSAEIEQAYRNYIKQKDGKVCRTCRNKRTANKDSVKKRQSEAAINNWQNKEYRERTSKSISEGKKKWWNENIARRTILSENNPMKDKETRIKFSENSSTPEDELVRVANEHGFDYLDRILGVRGGTRLLLKCYNGHVTEKRLDSFRSGHVGCSICANLYSKSEKEIYEYIKSIYGSDILENDRTIINPLELDIVIPEKKIAIEYCGLYWHGENKGKDRNYHLNKLERCNEKGYRLITIFEDEWANKKDIVKTRLKHILGLSDEKIFARKCGIKEISPKEANEFINRHHIQGATGSSIKLGAYYNGELVSVMTFAKPSLSKGQKKFNNIYELSRFCSSKLVIGIASKFISFFNKNYEWDEVFSYADRRWSDGNVYSTIGMEYNGETKPNYWYFKGEIKRIHRFTFRKNVLKDKLEVFDENKTEYENMIVNGYDRIWDCGNLKYTIKR